MILYGGNLANRMALTGGIILALIVGYYLFLGIDDAGLTDQTGTATVLSKRYEAAHKTYVTQFINNRSYVVPHMIGETYKLDLEINGQLVETLVSRDVYVSISESQRVKAMYRRGRLTGSMRVRHVTP